MRPSQAPGAAHKNLNDRFTLARRTPALSAPFRFPRFFVTTPAPCPYLVGKTERKVFTELSGPHAGELNDALGRIGFRRSQNVAYRPSCLDCAACVSVRVIAPGVPAERDAAAQCSAQRRYRGHRLQALGDRGAI